MRTFQFCLRLVVLMGLALILPGQVSLSGAQGTGSSMDGAFGGGVGSGYAVGGAIAAAPVQVQVPRSAMPGQNLMQFCKSDYDVDAGFCSGYATAIAEMMLVQPAYAQSACGHSAVKPQQLADMVKIEAEENPALLQLPAGVLVAYVMARTFPCDVGHGARGGAFGVDTAYTAEPLAP